MKDSILTLAAAAITGASVLCCITVAGLMVKLACRMFMLGWNLI